VPSSSSSSEEPEASGPTEEEMWDAVAESRLIWGARTNMPDARAYLDVNPVPDRVNFTLRFDTASVSVGEGMRIVRGVEEVLLAAAFDGSAPTGV
jgi:hypothetical protein